MLRLSGAVAREGRVDDGNTVTDFLAQERERGITIQSAAVHFEWRGHTVALVDTPGHVDFTVEVERALRVMDGAVLVVDAVAGVQAQTETVWRQAARYNLPSVAFVNKIDRDGADFEAACKSLAARLGCTPLPLQMPIYHKQSDSVMGFVDLLTMKCHFWESKSRSGATDADTEGVTFEQLVPISDSAPVDKPLAVTAAAWRSKLLECLADADDEFCELFLESLESSSDDGTGSDGIATRNLIEALRRVTCRTAASCSISNIGSGADESESIGERSATPIIVPCVMGASLRGFGVDSLLDAIVALLPAPDDRPAPHVSVTDMNNGQHSMRPLQRSLDEAQAADDPLCALAFKVTNDRQRGALVYLRIYTGRLQKRQTLQVVKGAPSSSSTTSFDPALLSSSATKADPEHVMSKERMTQFLQQ